MSKPAACGVIFTIFTALAALPAKSQERPPLELPKVEFSAGYSYANLNLGPQSAFFLPAGRSYNGAELSAKLNLRKHTSLLFDVASQWGHSKIPDPLGYVPYMQLYNTQFLAGPEFTLRKLKFNLFAHTLFGLTRTTLNQPNGFTYGGSLNYVGIAHRTNLAFGAGGGIERNWKKHFAFRLFQADYIPTRLGGKWESQFRLGTGMIVKF